MNIETVITDTIRAITTGTAEVVSNGTAAVAESAGMIANGPTVETDLKILFFLAIITGLSFGIPLVLVKLSTRREYLIGLLPIYLLTGNVLAQSFYKPSFLPAALLSLSVPVHAATFLITDILSELYGREYAKRAVWLGFIGQMFFTLILLLILASPILGEYHSELKAALGFIPRLIVASAAAYLASQFLDVYLFHKIREYTGGELKWIRNNLATGTAQLFDTCIFILIGFFGTEAVPDWRAFGWFVLFTWGFKVLVALVDTPFFYLATSRKAER